MEQSEIIHKNNLRDNKKIQKAIETILTEIGENPNREGLQRTPYRVAKAYEEWFGGYNKKPENVLNRTFTESSDMVIEGPIKFFSHCEHHLAPFYGKIWIGYIPEKRVTGLDKMVKLAEIYSRRLQTQERLTTQIADAMMNVLKPQGVVVVINAYHLCVSSRETRNPSAHTTTSAVRGVFEREHKARGEFMRLIK